MEVQHGPHEERHAQDAEDDRDGAGQTLVRQSPLQQREEHELPQDRHASHQHAVEGGDLHIAAQKAAPVAVLLPDGRILTGVALQLVDELRGKHLGEGAVDLVRALDEEGRGQGGEDGDGHHDGIDLILDDAKAHAERGDDEGKLTDLGQGAAAVDRLGKALPGEQDAEARDEQFSEDGHQGHDQDGDDVLHDHGGIQHHAHRQEEHRAEEVLDPGGEMLHPLGVDGACQQRARQESAQGGGEAQLVRQKHHAKADAEGSKEQGLVVHIALRLAQQSREDVDAQDQPQGQIKDQHAKLQRQVHTGDVLADRHGGEDDHHKDAGDILDDQGAEDQLGKGLLPDPQLVKGLDDDGGGAHGEHAAQKDTVHHAPAHGLTHQVAQHQHAEDFRQSRDDGGAAHGGQLMEIEFQAQAEHQHDDADLAPGLDGALVRHGEEPWHIRSHQEASQDIAQHQRQLEAFEKDRHHAGGEQHDRKIRYELWHPHRSFSALFYKFLLYQSFSRLERLDYKLFEIAQKIHAFTKNRRPGIIGTSIEKRSYADAKTPLSHRAGRLRQKRGHPKHAGPRSSERGRFCHAAGAG